MNIFPWHEISESTGIVAGTSKKTTETGNTNSGELITGDIELSKTSCSYDNSNLDQERQQKLKKLTILQFWTKTVWSFHRISHSQTSLVLKITERPQALGSREVPWAHLPGAALLLVCANVPSPPLLSHPSASSTLQPLRSRQSQMYPTRFPNFSHIF